jgi:hypothetical protein
MDPDKSDVGSAEDRAMRRSVWGNNPPIYRAEDRIRLLMRGNSEYANPKQVRALLGDYGVDPFSVDYYGSLAEKGELDDARLNDLLEYMHKTNDVRRVRVKENDEVGHSGRVYARQQISRNANASPQSIYMRQQQEARRAKASEEAIRELRNPVTK